ncbi:MAG TPA: protein kinase [Kofleriaceae bacterium]|nr:protein kinase [Kofleriaceae bacterium]
MIRLVAGIAATGRARPPSEPPARRGSRYVMGDLLGRGGMAEVFAGYAVGDHGFQKPVAIKRLLPELANDEVFVERLIEEAKLLVGMQHGNIVSVLDLAREGDDVFLVMEFVDGPSLRQLIKARAARGIPLGVATYVVQSAAAGLEFAHVRPGGAIIHADISPSNLLLTTSGEVRVADFGIARREGLGHGVVEGKWAYMAPEQARGEPLTPRSDVFALGVVLYELLTGQHPFGRAVTPDQRDDQMRVIPPRVVKPTVPHGLDAICMRALAHDARDRYGRMQQLIDALVEERFVNGYREGASDLAQAIREVAPKSDVVGAPRTMHTDRPVTLMTRSLLREVTPPRRPSQAPSRASAPPQAPSRASAPSYPLGPNDPPPRDAFPMQPTVGAQTMALLADAPPPQASPPPHAPPADAFPRVPSSGAQTVARMVDQVALAEAAQAAAAAMLQLPDVLRADGTPMPPFRMADAALPGDELASVVGGHTMTGHGGAAVAVESPRSHRWTIIVLAAATLFGVVAAIASQLARDPDPDAAPRSGSLVVPAPRPLDEAPGKPEAPTAVAAGEPSSDPSAPPVAQPGGEPVAQPVVSPTTQPVVQPTVQPATQPTVPPQVEPAVPPAPAPGSAAGTGSTPAAPAASPPPGPATAVIDPATPPAPARGAAPAVAPREPIVIDPAIVIDPQMPSTPGTPREVTRPARRSGGKEARRKVEPGILSVTSVPWSWVTVGNQTKETPGAKFYLAPGTYQVTFHNQENGLVKVERVTIESGRLKKLSEQMDR